MPGSPSNRGERCAAHAVHQPLHRSFDRGGVSAPRLDVDQAPYLPWVQQASHALTALAGVRQVADYADDARCRSCARPTATSRCCSSGLAAADDHRPAARGGSRCAQRSRRWRAALARARPTARSVAVTGGPAADFDVNALSAAGGDRAEKSALPLTLIILLMAFGTLVAASCRSSWDSAPRPWRSALAFVLAKLIPVSNLLSNVVTMVGLAIGIDYSLLMVTHYRENQPNERRRRARGRHRRARRADHHLVRASPS